MSHVHLYGPDWSAYARTARLALIEKHVSYELIPVDFSGGEMPAEQLQRQPFGKVPTLDHDGYQIYETSAICRYVDCAFDGPLLQPTEPKALGRMAQIIAILDAYLSDDIRMGIVNEGLIKPMLGVEVDRPRLEQAFANTENGFKALASCIGTDVFMVGEDLSLADLHAAPLFDYIARTPGGNGVIDSQPVLRAWWDGMATRESVVNTAPDLSAFNPSNPHSP